MRVSFKFSPRSYGKEILVEAYLFEPEMKAPPGLIVKPVLGARKIVNTEILDANGDKITQTPKYGQSITLKVTTQNIPGEILTLSLWERDTLKDTGHDASSNTKLWSGQSKTIDLKGIVEQKIQLTLDMQKEANKGVFDGSEHEFYLLVEATGMKTISATTAVSNTVVKPATPIVKQAPVKIKNDAGFDKIKVDDTNKVVKVVVPEKKKEEKTGTCVCKEDDLTWGGHPNVSCDFRKKVVAISKRQNFDPNHLMAVMWVESAKTFSPSKIDLKVIGYNSKGKELRDYVPLSEKEIKDLPVSFSGAVGLIQFTPVAIDELNNYYGYSLTKRKLALMTQIDQLDYVEKYIEYWRTANKITIKLTQADLYLLVFAPSKMNGSVDSTTLYKEGTVYYKANASVDTDKKDGITKKELAYRAYESFEEGNKKENKASNFSCGVIIEKKIKEVSSEGVLSEMKTLADSHKSYLPETDKNRTADTDAGLEKMDCSEFVSRYLHKLGVTKNIIYMTTANMTSEAAFRKVIDNDNIDLVSESKTSKFKPQKGDVFAWGRSKNGSWGGHTGVVYDFDETKDTVTILESIGKVGAVGEKKQVKNGGHSGTNCTRTAVYDRLGGALYGHDGWFGYYRPKNYTKKL